MSATRLLLLLPFAAMAALLAGVEALAALAPGRLLSLSAQATALGLDGLWLNRDLDRGWIGPLSDLRWAAFHLRMVLQFWTALALGLLVPLLWRAATRDPRAVRPVRPDGALRTLGFAALAVLFAAAIWYFVYVADPARAEGSGARQSYVPLSALHPALAAFDIALGGAMALVLAAAVAILHSLRHPRARRAA